jgi:hypothetical protein
MTILIYFLITIVFFCELSVTIAYGWFMGSSEVLSYIKSYNKFIVNQFNSNIISPDIDWSDEVLVTKKLSEPADYISTTILSLFSKYHINNKGRVLRWSKGHKEIDNLFKTLKTK